MKRPKPLLNVDATIQPTDLIDVRRHLRRRTLKQASLDLFEQETYLAEYVGNRFEALRRLLRKNGLPASNTDAVLHAAACGQHEDGGLIAFIADAPAEIEPVSAGEHDVQDDDAVLAERRDRDYARLHRGAEARTARLHRRGAAGPLSTIGTGLIDEG